INISQLLRKRQIRWNQSTKQFARLFKRREGQRDKKKHTKDAAIDKTLKPKKGLGTGQCAAKLGIWKDNLSLDAAILKS
uniref:Uncharacterized protein n=1 Tax=Ciona intestinalis TaxID=7719 RepID=H2XMJ8_CIOIN